MKTNHDFTRRHAIKGLTLGSGSIAFAPFLQSMAAHASGDPYKLPQRFVFVIKASGLDRQDLVPEKFDATLRSGIAWNDADKGKDFTRTKLADVSWKDYDLPDALTPFDSIRDRLTVIQGLSGDNFTGNHTSGYGVLSCINSEKTPLAPSLDYRLGECFSAGPYPMYGMALSGTLQTNNGPPENGYCYPNISAKGKAKPVPFQASPEKAHRELFGNAVMSKEEAQRKLTVQSNLMDFLKEDAKRISKQLSSSERERFENYTGAFESLRMREARKSDLRDTIRAKAPEFTDLYTSLVETDRHQCQFNIATSALITGLTNVVTLRPDTLGTVYTGFGIRGTHLHPIGHGREVDNGWTAAKTRTEINKHHLRLIADMAKKLDSIPEGDGTMLDNTLIVYTSCAGGAHHSGQTDWPYVLAGGIRNRLKMGRYLQYPSYKQPGHKTIANLYIAMLHAAGMDSGEHFGQIDPALKDFDLSGPLSEILA